MEQKIPEHVAIVMDGNGRWAQNRAMPRLAGHNAGMKALKEIVKAADQLGVKYLTVYAFSTENWSRPIHEVNGIFNLLVKYVDKELRELHENHVKVRILGDYSKLPRQAIDRLDLALHTTRENTGLRFNIALNYGSRLEIINAVKEICTQVESRNLSVADIDEKRFSDYLETAGMPEPDLLIRTSGEIRLSNFLLWQSAYSELYFTDVLWPDFKRKHLEEAIAEYQNRKRRYGGI